MIDVVYIATIIAFFALMVAFVRWCEHIIGKDDGGALPYDGIDDETVDPPTVGAAAAISAPSVDTPEELPV